MKPGLFFYKPSAQAVIDDINRIRILVLTHGEVGWLNVPMHILPIMNESQYFHHLDAQRQHCVHTESTPVLR